MCLCACVGLNHVRVLLVVYYDIGCLVVARACLFVCCVGMCLLVLFV